ncbi:hypothetical protein [Gordonia westfalica]|uniref:Uncharacterized protein n=1 Tax=Gordonia westfalica TaxID=158898 RepID=A0A1H2I0M7_9ACTN|nr:hypothetical protein SAMN04488548_134783 [Gordonia westfalica]
MIAWLIVDHELWERPASPDEREHAVLYNMSTVVTLTIGVMVFYVVVFVPLLLTAWWTIPPDVFADQIGHPAGFSSLVIMAWLVASVATLGGALGSGMETTMQCGQLPTVPANVSGSSGTTPTVGGQARVRAVDGR